MKIFLISNSYSFGKDYLDHCMGYLLAFLHDVSKILFVPYALNNYEKYYKLVSERFEKVDILIDPIHHYHNKHDAVKNAEAIFVGGGNSFRLLNTLYEYNLLGQIREQVIAGLPYIGASAGTNLVCPTIMTTNDMPICFPPSLDALNLVPFQINPHYFDPNPFEKIMMETRAQRIAEYHEEKDLPVIGLKEDACLEIYKNEIKVLGSNGAKIFFKDKESICVNENKQLNDFF